MLSRLRGSRSLVAAVVKAATAQRQAGQLAVLYSRLHSTHATAPAHAIAATHPAHASSSDEGDEGIGDTIPINILKDGSDPVLKAEADYPDWLHGILDEEQLTISEAVMKGAENLTAKQGKRMLRDIRRAEIKEHNSINKKH